MIVALVIIGAAAAGLAALFALGLVAARVDLSEDLP